MSSASSSNPPQPHLPSPNIPASSLSTTPSTTSLYLPSTSSNTPSNTLPNQPPSPSSPPPDPRRPYRPIFLALLLACPALALLPPRKLDLYTFGLGATWIVSGREVWAGSVRNRQAGRERMWEEMRGWRADERSARQDNAVVASSPIPQSGLQPQAQQQQQQQQHQENAESDHDPEESEGEGIGGAIRKVWMGGETAGWEKRRMEREREEMASGKGYADLIMEQVREVLPGWGRGQGEEGAGGNNKTKD